MFVKWLNVLDAWIQSRPGVGIHEQRPDRFRRGSDLKLVREMDRGAVGNHVLWSFEGLHHLYFSIRLACHYSKSIG
jgi:hypothetical protein